MQKYEKLKYMRGIRVLLLALCIVSAVFFANVMAGSRQVPVVKAVSLKIGNKNVAKRTYQMQL